MDRREFLALCGRAAVVPPLLALQKSQKPTFPLKEVIAGETDGYAQMYVKFNGEFLSGCYRASVEHGTAVVTVTDSHGRWVIAGGDFLQHTLSGQVEIWTRPSGLKSDGFKLYVVKIPDGPGYYEIWRFTPRTVAALERIG